MNRALWGLRKTIMGTDSANMAQEELWLLSSSVIFDKALSGINCQFSCISFLSIFGIPEGKDLAWLTLHASLLASAGLIVGSNQLQLVTGILVQAHAWTPILSLLPG